MLNYSKFLSVVFGGLVLIGALSVSTPARASEGVLQSKATVQAKGVVLDSSNQPVIGATVVEVGTKGNGTLTGSDGTFTLNVAQGASLQISYIGYKTETVKVTGRSLTIILQDDS
ncbi:MAG: carboxypeptidase-like regulatory domain-containing protein, partial [Prevotella sp.]|nr:carboxypeptidase-like regulatory domain-containing protein [Prevotella sp.]